MRKSFRTYSLWALLLAMILGLPMSASAEKRFERNQMPHEIRIGWGDQLFETLMWHNPLTIVNTMPETFSKDYAEDYAYSQHLFLEYQYRINSWFGLGALLDNSEFHWDKVTRNGQGIETAREPGHYCYNVILMATFRFTYLHHPYVDLYSEIGFGVGVNGGTERSPRGHLTECGYATDIRLLGVSANYRRWFMTFDLGGLYSLQDVNHLFLVSSRIMSASIGVRF